MASDAQDVQSNTAKLLVAAQVETPGTGEHKEQLEEVEIDNDRLETVDLSTPPCSYERDFCFKVALILAPEYAPPVKIKRLIQDIVQTQKKKILISLTIQFHNEVYKNNLLKTKVKEIFVKYKRSSEALVFKDRHAIESHCIENFEKMPPLQELLLQVHYEYLGIFRGMQDKVFAIFVKFFLNEKFMTSVLNSALFSIRYPELVAAGTELSEESLAAAAQHIVFAIQSIQHALKEVFKERQYEVLISPTSQVTGAEEDDKSDAEKKKQGDAGVKSSADPTAMDPFFKSYLFEILQDQKASESANVAADAAGSGSLVTDQLVRVTALFKAMQRIHVSNTLPSQTPDLERSAFSIVRGVDDTPIPSARDEFGSVPNRVLLLETNFPGRRCHFTKVEESAALLDRFPLVEALNDMSATRASLLKFLRLYPGVTERIGPHLIWIELGTGLIGTLTATHGILNPRSNPALARIWRACTNGAVFLVFSLGASINIYLWYNPGKHDISDEIFYEKIFSGPAVLTLIQTTWAIISPLAKEIFLPRGSCRYILRLSMDIGTKSLYNAGVFLFAALTFFNLPKTLAWQILPIIPGFLVSLGQTFSPAKERLNTLMTYITFVVFSSNVIKSSLPNSPDRSFEGNWQVILRSSFLIGLSIYSTALLAKNYLKFLREYIHEDTLAATIIVRKVYVPVVNGRLDLSEFAGQGVLIDMKDYHQLAADVREGRIEQAEAQVHASRLSQPLLFSKAAQPNRGGLIEGLLADTKLSEDVPDHDFAKQPKPKIKTSRSSFCDRCTIM